MGVHEQHNTLLISRRIRRSLGGLLPASAANPDLIFRKNNFFGLKLRRRDGFRRD